MGASLAPRRPDFMSPPGRENRAVCHAPGKCRPRSTELLRTTMPLGLSAYGVLVTNYEGRPTSSPANPLHPSSGGAVNAQIQASLLDLYDPIARNKFFAKAMIPSGPILSNGGRSSTRSSRRTAGKAWQFFPRRSTRPRWRVWKKQFETPFPRATWVAWNPVSDENIYLGIKAGDRSEFPAGLSSRSRQSNPVARLRFPRSRERVGQKTRLSSLKVVGSRVRTTNEPALW